MKDDVVFHPKTTCILRRTYFISNDDLILIKKHAERVSVATIRFSTDKSTLWKVQTTLFLRESMDSGMRHFIQKETFEGKSTFLLTKKLLVSLHFSKME